MEDLQLQTVRLDALAPCLVMAIVMLHVMWRHATMIMEIAATHLPLVMHLDAKHSLLIWLIVELQPSLL